MALIAVLPIVAPEPRQVWQPINLMLCGAPVGLGLFGPGRTYHQSVYGYLRIGCVVAVIAAMVAYAAYRIPSAHAVGLTGLAVELIVFLLLYRRKRPGSLS